MAVDLSTLVAGPCSHAIQSRAFIAGGQLLCSAFRATQARGMHQSCDGLPQSVQTLTVAPEVAPTHTDTRKRPSPRLLSTHLKGVLRTMGTWEKSQSSLHLESLKPTSPPTMLL